MKNNGIRCAVIVIGLLGAAAAHAATDWSVQDYDLYPGDFDGDGKTDLLYVAKDASKASGIARSDGGAPNLPFQSWPSNHLGIPWYGNQYLVVVADFNGDLKADVLLQRATAGDSYLLLADANGKIMAISQTISNTALSLNWSADQHRILAGDFNNDGKADLFFQATRPTVSSGTAATNAVVYADANGQFTTSPTQTWTDASWSAFKWSTQNSNILIGDFNGDGTKDLLVQARPKIVMIDYDVPIPVPTFPPNMNGVALSQGGATPFQQVGVQQWSRTANGVDWSPLSSNIVVGDFNGDGRADVLMQSRVSTRSSYLLTGNASGAAFGTGTALATNVTWSSDTYRLVAGNFDGAGGAGIYYQAVTSGGTNYYANVVTGAMVTQTAHNPTAPTGVLPTTAVGNTVGSFAVGDNGAATYSIPIVVPPGVAGMQPQLSINYASGGGNGLLGIGWGIGGLSAIVRCAKTIAQDGVVGAVALTLSDRFCLDGNKLRRTSGTYGVAGSTYRTEMETFARVTANGTAGNGPQHFVVEGKDGARYEYGSSADSRIESLNPNAPTTVHTWALNRVSDRHGNAMTISYQKDGSPNGSYRPDTISYTSNSGLAAAYRVVFFWDLRQNSDMPRMYVAGGQVIERYRLNRIETQYNDPAVGTWRLVRKYQLAYNISGATPRSRLAAVQECDRNGACLAPTTIGWQDGLAGWSASDVTSSSNSGAIMEWSFAIDVNGDGRDDLVYPQTVGLTTYWHYMTANGSGGFNSPVNTSINAGDSTLLQYTRAVPIDYFSDGRVGLLVDAPGFSTRQILRWNGSTLALTNTNISVTLMGKEWVADFDGDGRQDFLYATTSGTNGLFQVQKNSGSASAPAQFAAATTFYSIPNGQNASPFVGWYASAFARLMDFNGDGRADLVYSQLFASCGGEICTYTTAFRAVVSTGSSFVDTPAVWTCDQIGAACDMNPIVADFNGDGLSDVMTLVGDITGSSWSIAYGNGAGLTTPAAISPPGSLYNVVLDYNGDGRADILSSSGASLAVAISNGTGFDAGPTIPLAATVAGNTLRLLDLDGDGQQDIGYKNGQYRVRRHNGTSPDFVASITDGFGNSVAIQYAPLTDGTVYSKCPVSPVCPTAAQFPVLDIQPTMHVVKSFTASDGIGGSYSATQKYTGLRAHAQGRGLLGFAGQETIDGRTGLKTTSSFRQDFPYIGFESQATAYQPDGVSIISQSVNTPAELPVQGGTNEDRHFPYVQQIEKTSREVGGPSNNLQIARITTTQTLDANGNVTNLTTTTADLTGSGQTFQTSTVSTYETPDVTNWCLDFITRQRTTNTVQGVAGPPRTVDYVKDAAAAKCRVSQQIVEPDDVAVKVTTTLGYDTFGHVSSRTVAAANIASRTTSIDFGAQGVFPVTVTNALNQAESKTFDYAHGVVKTETDANQITTSFDYDGFGRLMRETRADQTKTEVVYSSCNVANGYCGDSRLRYQVEKREIDAAAQVTRVSRTLMDMFGRALYDQSQTPSGAFSIVAANYDNQGRASQRSQPYFSGMPAYFTTYAYDLIGRATQEQRRISEADAGPQTVLYGYNRLIRTLQDPNFRITTKEINAIGQVVRMTDAASGITNYEYDHFGNMTKAIDPAGNQIVNTYNIRGFKLTTNDPDMGAWAYTYYPTGELWTQTDAKAQTLTLTYDKLSRPATRQEVEGTTTFMYGDLNTDHNIGKLKSVQTVPGSITESFTYDSKGRLENATTNIEGTDYVVSHSYNSTSGLLDTVTYPTSTSAVPGSRFKVKYEYASGLLTRVRDFNTPATVYWEQIATNASGQTLDEQLGNGLHTYSNYDGVTGLLSSITTGSTSQVQNLTYQWDKVGNLTQRKDLNLSLTEDFVYDNLYRLDKSTLNAVATPNLDMTYDATGNITARAEGATSSSFNYTTQQAGCTYNFPHVQPHAVRKVGTTVYCYNENGNMVQRGGSNITWYSYNLPNRIDNGSNYAQFFYAADRSRYKQIAFTASGGVLPAGTETTLYVGGVFEKVTKPSGVLEYKHYVLAGNDPVAIRTLRSNSINDTRYLHVDHLGNLDAVTSESGTVVLKLSYDAFGKRRNPTSWSGSVPGSDWTSIAALTHRGFTFHEELDNVDLIHMNGRVYDPNIARFISADPIIQAPLLSQSLNRYSYVMNNPLSLIDMNGYSWVSKHFKKLGRWFKRQWDSIRRNLNTIVGVALIVVGAIFENPALIKAGWALIVSPVQVYRGPDGLYVGYRYGFGMGTRGDPAISVGSGTPPPMTAPPGAVSLQAGGSLSDAQRATITDEILNATSSIRSQRFATEQGAAMALHVALSEISRQYGIEIGAAIYKVPGRFGYRYVVGTAVTDFAPGYVGIGESNSRSPPSVLNRTLVARWHTHPTSDDFSDLGDYMYKRPGDIEISVHTHTNIYASLLKSDTVLLFRGRDFDDAMLQNTKENTAAFKCVTSGHHRVYKACQ